MNLQEQMEVSIRQSMYGVPYDGEIDPYKAAFACAEIAERNAIEFLEHIMAYERETGDGICYDDRSAKELYQLFLNSKDNE